MKTSDEASSPVPVPVLEPSSGRRADGWRRRHSLRRGEAALWLGGYLAIGSVLLAAGWLITDAGFLAGLRSWDEQLNASVAARREPWLDQLALAAGRIADTMPVVVTAVVVEAVLVARRRWAELLLLIVALSIELAAFITVNEIVTRPRPNVPKLGLEPDTYSFPSGHVAVTIVVWGSIATLLVWHRHWRPSVVGAVVVLLAVAVAFSRVYRGMHHLTDVVAGASLGAGALAVGIGAVWLTRAPRGAPDAPR